LKEWPDGYPLTSIAKPEALRAGEDENEQNKLLEHQHGVRLDATAPSAAIGANPQLETVGEVDRAADSRS